ncbi:methyltransferase domain-containing protein [Phytoactinopolyspora limicola]|uniref:methyltransferase domain-containing protein n=1 Tax=Phytoactinopolyspora limicola TaxID=2715536 RepID=UPI00140B9607|nr:methyltransferase domain-containing protein [Phytoactinopolyspora limicola]
MTASNPHAGDGRIPDHLQHHPDRLRWNQRYQANPPTFTAHRLVTEALAAGFPDGPVLELAAGRSGNALELAATGRHVVAVDVSDVALDDLAAQARQRGLSGRIDGVLADVPSYRPRPAGFALVLATFYWDADAFAAGCRAVASGGLVAWQALTDDPAAKPGTGRWRVPHGELSRRLPTGFAVLMEEPSTEGDRRSTVLLARRQMYRRDH